MDYLRNGSVEVSETGQVEIIGSDDVRVTCITQVIDIEGRRFAVLVEQGREPPVVHFWAYHLIVDRAVVSPINDPDVRTLVAASYAARQK